MVARVIFYILLLYSSCNHIVSRKQEKEKKRKKKGKNRIIAHQFICWAKEMGYVQKAQVL